MSCMISLQNKMRMTMKVSHMAASCCGKRMYSQTSTASRVTLLSSASRTTAATTTRMTTTTARSSVAFQKFAKATVATRNGGHCFFSSSSKKNNNNNSSSNNNDANNNNNNDDSPTAPRLNDPNPMIDTIATGHGTDPTSASASTTSISSSTTTTTTTTTETELERIVYVHPLSQVILEYLQDFHHDWICNCGLDQSLTIHRDGTFELKFSVLQSNNNDGYSNNRIWTSYDEIEKKHWLTVHVSQVLHERYLLQDNLLPAWHGNNKAKSLPERIHASVNEMIIAVNAHAEQLQTLYDEMHRHSAVATVIVDAEEKQPCGDEVSLENQNENHPNKDHPDKTNK